MGIFFGTLGMQGYLRGPVPWIEPLLSEYPVFDEIHLFYYYWDQGEQPMDSLCIAESRLNFKAGTVTDPISERPPGKRGYWIASCK